MSECDPSDISGINSSTTTYSMAPAAKLSRYGRMGTTTDAARIVTYRSDRLDDTGKDASDERPWVCFRPRNGAAWR
jgi:hypothetical protein